MSSNTDEEFLTYLLLFATHADLHFDDEEKKLILSKVDETTYDRVNKVFQNQNDIQRINSIRSYLEERNYKENDLESIIKKVMEAFMADGDYSTLEQNLMIGLRRIFKEYS